MRHGKTRAAGIALCVALLAAMAVAAPPKTQPSPAARAVDDFVGKLREAFPLGMWQGRFTEVDKDGAPRLISDDPQCVAAKDREDLIAEITDPMVKLAASGKCTHEGSGPGSLMLGLRCTSDGGRVIAVSTSGTYGPDGMQFRMQLTGKGEGAPAAYEFNAEGRRVGECPQPAPTKPDKPKAP